MSQLILEVDFKDKLLTRKRIIMRDDQISWVEALDLAQWLSARKKTFILIDTGCFSLSQLEWLSTKKSLIVSSPEADRSWSELLLLNKVAKRFGQPIIFAYKDRETGEKLWEIYSALQHLGRCGVDLHISGQNKTLDSEALGQLANCCHRGRSWFVYYHYGPIETWLNQLAKEMAWIHLSDRFFDMSQKNELEELLRSFPRHPLRLVIHVEDESKGIELIEFAFKKGCFVVFYQPPWSSFLKKRYFLRRQLPFRAFHLEEKALF